MINFNVNDLKLSVLDTKYYFNGENVTAIVKVVLDAPYEFMELFGSIYFEVKDVAKCHPDDTYDRELGMRVARAKAEARAYRLAKDAVIRRWNGVLDTIESLAPLKTRFIDKAERCDEHNREYIKQITHDNLF